MVGREERGTENEPKKAPYPSPVTNEKRSQPQDPGYKPNLGHPPRYLWLKG